MSFSASRASFDRWSSGSEVTDEAQGVLTLIGSNICRAFPLPTGAGDNDERFGQLLDAIRRRGLPNR